MGIFHKYLPTFTGLGLSTIGVTLYTLRETVFLEKFRKLFSSYQKGEEVPVPNNYITKFQEVMDDLKVPPQIRNKIKIFNLPFYDPLHFGMFIEKYGGAIGIPRNFKYDDPATPISENIFIVNTDLDWYSDYGKELAKTLVLSADAQKYAIAREFKKLQYNERIFSIGVYSALMTSLCGMYNILDIKGKLPERSRFQRLLVLFTFFGFGATNYILLTLLNAKKNDREIDKELCKLGPKYIQGGKEYYEKTLQRNEIIECLLKGVRWGSSLTVKTFGMPLQQRKSFFETKFEELPQTM